MDKAQTVERWFAGRRDRRANGRRVTWRLNGQPEEGFADVRGVMDWLLQRGFIVLVDDPEEGDWHRGWGDPYCAVAGSRRDPWEPVPDDA